MSNEKIQKRFVTLEIISKGEKPVDLNETVQDALLTAARNAISYNLDLRYKDDQGNNRRHDFVGVDIKEIK